MLSIILFVCLHTRPAIAVENQPVFAPESFTVDYGTIAYGSDGDRDLYFTNTGTEPLLIQHIQTTCGCTVPSWPKEPILPGKRAKITFRYDTKRVGSFNKTLTVLTNETDGTEPKKHAILVKGTVLEAVSSGNLSIPTDRP